jgi:hypothetical protein
VFVSVGSHKIEVKAPGYATMTGDVTVRPNSSVGLSLTPQTEEQARSSSAPPNARKLAGYGAVVLGAGLAGVGLYSSLKVNSINNSDDFKTARQVPNSIDVCEYAKENPTVNGVDSSKIKDGCSSASTFGALQWVFYGLGVVSAGAGTYLLMTDKPKKEAEPGTAKVRVVPNVRPGGNFGGVDVLVTF